MSQPLVSIITPTCGREPFLVALAACIEAQDWREIEWLVLDDSSEPSPSLTASPCRGLRYVHVPQRLSIGEKRNRLVDMSRGEFIAHFDDDDYYGPGYITAMMSALLSSAADMARLSGFFVGHLERGAVGYYRTMLKRGVGFEFGRQGISPILLETIDMPLIHLAYGWSYFYRRRVWQANPFPHIDTFEDREFVRAATGSCRLQVLEDRGVNCIHSVHRHSSSRCFPQFNIPPFLIASLAPGAARHFNWLRRIATNRPAPAEPRRHENGIRIVSSEPLDV